MVIPRTIYTIYPFENGLPSLLKSVVYIVIEYIVDQIRGNKHVTNQVRMRVSYESPQPSVVSYHLRSSSPHLSEDEENTRGS